MNTIARIITTSIIGLSIASLSPISRTAIAQEAGGGPANTPITVEPKAPEREAPTDPLSVALCKQHWGTAAKLVEQQIATLPPAEQQSAYGQQLKAYRVQLMALEFGVTEVNRQDLVTLGCVEAQPDQITGTATKS
ncbi:hypothetical protein Pse7367_1769 [Thalassoporum mexicanum PCC 7367]|uniref:hypothetical protein n=1 Tax=Thalassoporum mexicanum TaxID=3457544 RepID=UPI00029FD343|nr:hypothetical protein [Pseudanabaena sp. PCC 7367]AFY70047.1 hypothetical protein Pse7367_1769 [Pseudanabaena sp. PCC 7367]